MEKSVLQQASAIGTLCLRELFDGANQHAEQNEQVWSAVCLGLQIRWIRMAIPLLPVLQPILQPNVSSGIGKMRQRQTHTKLIITQIQDARNVWFSAKDAKARPIHSIRCYRNGWPSILASQWQKWMASKNQIHFRFHSQRTCLFSWTPRSRR